MALGVHIVLQPQIVLHVVHFYGSAQVSALESAVEYQDIVLLWHADGVGATETEVEFPLRREFGQVFEEKLVEIVLEISLAGLLIEQAVSLADLLAAEQLVKVDAAGRAALVVGHQVAVADDTRVGVVDDDAAELLAVEVLGVKLEENLVCEVRGPLREEAPSERVP